MEDEDLEAIRARRLAELQQQFGGKGSNANAPSMGEDEGRKQKEEEMKNHILCQILTQEARARLNTVALAKPEKGKMVENMLINMATMGQIPGKLGEDELIRLLERVSEQTTRKTTVKFDRRRAALDDSDEDF